MTLDAVADELAIRNLAGRFTDAVNRRAADDLAALMTTDAEWHVPGMDVAVGPAGAAERITGLLANLPGLIQLLHSGTVTLDGDTAHARWYLSETARDASGTGLSFIGYYDDELARTSEGWRFTSRRFSFLYRGSADLGGKFSTHRGDPA